MSKRSLHVIPCLLLFGCITPEKRKVATVSPGARELVCDYEVPTGSRIPQRICRFKDEVEEDAQMAQESVRQLENLGSNNTGMHR